MNRFAHLSRLVTEALNLQDALIAIGMKRTADLAEKEANLLEKQTELMDEYLAVLALRIKWFVDENF